ncbi:MULTISPECIES: hypothetical protein [Methanobrevibacter]|nr:hypothetical protein [Methanobrevibacter smithii]
MIDNPEDLKEKALANKPSLRRQYVNIPVGDEEKNKHLWLKQC